MDARVCERMSVMSERRVFELAASLIRQAGMESGPCTIFKQLARNIFLNPTVAGFTKHGSSGPFPVLFCFFSLSSTTYWFKSKHVNQILSDGIQIFFTYGKKWNMNRLRASAPSVLADRSDIPWHCESLKMRQLRPLHTGCVTHKRY